MLMEAADAVKGKDEADKIKTKLCKENVDVKEEGSWAQDKDGDSCEGKQEALNHRAKLNAWDQNGNI